MNQDEYQVFAFLFKLLKQCDNDPLAMMRKLDDYIDMYDYRISGRKDDETYQAIDKLLSLKKEQQRMIIKAVL